MTTVLEVQIDRFVDEYQPGIVECSLIDGHGKKHLFIEKLPIVTDADLWSDSLYPAPGAIACEIKREFEDPNGQTLLEVSTELPWHVESTEGETRFVVRASQVRHESDA